MTAPTPTPEERAETAWCRFTNDFGDIRSRECAERFIADQIRAAEADARREEREAIAAYIEEQNGLVNTMFDPPGRHDNFVLDLCEGIRKRGEAKGGET